jgi:hypothetical protein
VDFRKAVFRNGTIKEIQGYLIRSNNWNVVDDVLSLTRESIMVLVDRVY